VCGEKIFAKNCDWRQRQRRCWRRDSTQNCIPNLVATGEFGECFNSRESSANAIVKCLVRVWQCVCVCAQPATTKDRKMLEKCLVHVKSWWHILLSFWPHFSPPSRCCCCWSAVHQRCRMAAPLSHLPTPQCWCTPLRQMKRKWSNFK